MRRLRNFGLGLPVLAIAALSACGRGQESFPGYEFDGSKDGVIVKFYQQTLGNEVSDHLIIREGEGPIFHYVDREGGNTPDSLSRKDGNETRVFTRGRFPVDKGLWRHLQDHYKYWKEWVKEQEKSRLERQLPQ